MEEDIGSFSEIPDRRAQRRITTYSPEVFDKNTYFEGVALMMNLGVLVLES